MTIADLYSKLKDLNVRMRVVGERLDLQAPKGVLDNALMEKIKASKQELISFLHVRKEVDRIAHAIPVAAAQTAYPMSAAQKRLWVLSQSEEASVAYNMSGIYEFEGQLQQDILERACATIIARHESLRTVFREDEQGEIKQHILTPEDAGYHIIFEDLRAQHQPEVQLINRLQQGLNQPFQTDKSLLRLYLYQLTDNKWVFASVIHHIIIDGLSMNRLIDEIGMVYNAFVQGKPDPLLPLSIQYKDYVMWQLNQDAGATERHKAYWLEQMSGDLPVLQLFTDRVRPAVKTYNGAYYSQMMDAALVKTFRQFCHEEGGTLYMGLLAVANMLCYHYTGLEDIIIGSPVAGRPHADLEDQIGFYANTLALRTRFAGAESFTTLFNRVKQVVAGAFEHQVYPFDELVKELKIQRDISRNPLFDIQVLLQNAGRNENASNSLHQLEVKTYRSTARLISVFDIVFNFVETADGLEARIVYNQDIYSEKHIAQLLLHLQSLLHAAVAAPLQPIQQLEYLDEAEKRLLLETFSRPLPHAKHSAGVMDLFSKQVAAVPDNLAVFYENTTLSYKELDEKSDQLAAHLKRECHINREDIVGVMMDRSDKTLISILGIMKAGAVYVPVDPHYPRSRKEFIFQDTGLKVLLTQTDYFFDIDYYEGRIIAMDVQTDFEIDPACTPEPLTMEQLSYIIYTSGSTGQPKGVMIEHGALVNGITGLKTIMDIQAGEKMLQFNSLSFDVSMMEIFMALTSGAALHIINEEQKRNPSLLEDYILQHALMTAALPPALLHQLQIDKLPSLRKLLVGGEPPPADKVRAFLKTGSCFNIYGPTETTIGVTVYKMAKGSDIGQGVIPIGKPIANACIYILNQHGNLCPAGVVGEIYIGGYSVGRGYLNNGALSAEKFVTDPFHAGAYMYRSGDLGKWQEDGNLVFAGRRDEQVKIRGYRIEPGEIEKVLQAHAAVEGAAVLVKEHKGGEKELVAYVAGKRELDITGLRNWLGAYIPSYMIPAHFVLLPVLPLTTHGKIDRKKLPDPEGWTGGTGVEYIAPRTAEEVALAAVYESVLKKTKVGVRDDFFILGGDSIKAIQVVSRLRQQYGLAIGVQDVLMCPVLEALAGRVKHTGIRYIPQEAVSGAIPLSPVQLLFFNNASQEKHYYNQSVLLQGKGTLSAEGLQFCLAQLVLHHDALRMVFHGREQTNLGAAQGYSWTEQTVAAADFEATCNALQSGFSLSTGPLLQAGLFRFADGDRLLLVAHHLVVDAVSWRILLEDLSTLYGQYQRNEAVSLPLKTDSFLYWQQQQLLYAGSEVMAAERSYWSSVAGCAVAGLPVDDATGSNTAGDVTSDFFILEEEITHQLLTQCYKAYRTEINDILLTALLLGVSECFGVSELALMLEGHGRENIGGDVDVTRTVGWFTTVYPVLLKLSASGELFSHLVEVKEHLHRVPNKGIGYGILRYLNGEQYMLTPSLSFNYLGDFEAGAGSGNTGTWWELSGQPHGRSIAASWQRESELDITGITIDGKLRISVSYSNKRYQSSTINKFIAAYHSKLVLLISELSRQTTVHVTPVDLSYKALSMSRLTELQAAGEVADVYRLSPLQEGLYYQWQMSPQSTAYFEQMSYHVEASLDTALLAQSYDALVARHGVLRTSFIQEAGIQLQVVRSKVPSGFRYEDVSNDAGFDVAAYRLSDRLKGFDLNTGSQMRLTVLGLGDGRYEFIWSHHHILMDGWCNGILIKEFFSIYKNLSKGTVPVLPAVHPYVNYIDWLLRQDMAAGLHYWRQYLLGYDTVSMLPKKAITHLQPFNGATMGFTLDTAVRESLKSLCAEMGITEGTFIQVAWGILLSQYSHQDDVVFGEVVSGRPPELEGVEEMIGMFINTIPVRIKINNDSSISELLKQAYQSHVEGTVHHYTQLADVQAQSALKQGLFEHTITFENYPAGTWTANDATWLHLPEAQLSAAFDVNNYDFSVVVVPGENFLFKFTYNESAYDSVFVQQVRDHFLRLIKYIAENPAAGIHQLSALNPVVLQEPADDHKTRISDYTAGFSAAVSDDF